MDEKRQLRSHNLPVMTRYRPTRLAVFALLGVVALYALFVGHASPLKLYESAAALRSSAVGYKVPLEAHIISKCPDTRVRCRRDRSLLLIDLLTKSCTGCPPPAGPARYAKGTW